MSHLNWALRWQPPNSDPRRPRASIDGFLEDRRTDVRTLVRDHPGLTIISLAQLLSVEVTVAQLIVKPLLESGELATTGVRRGTKYYLAGDVPK